MVALLFSYGSTASVGGKTHKPAATEEVVVQEVADSNDSLDENNVVDNDNAVLSNVNDETASNSLNVHNVVPELSAPTKTLTHHQVKPAVVSTVNVVPVSTVNTVPVVSHVSAVPVQANVVKSKCALILFRK